MVKQQIEVLMSLWKMKSSNFEYACKITLPSKKDESQGFVDSIVP